MPQNQFKTFAAGDGANTLDPATYAAQGYLAQGFQNGVAQPYDVNTVFRQVTTIAAALGQFTADNQAADVLDDGIVANFEAKFTAALKGVMASSSVHYGVATGTGDAMVVTAIPPMVAATSGGYQPGSFLIVKTPATANATTAPTVNANSIGNIDITRAGTGTLAVGDNPASTWMILFFDGVGCYRIGLTKSDVIAAAPTPPAAALWHTGNDTSTTAAAIVVTATPAVTTRVADLAYLIFPAHACAGATTLNVGFGVEPLTRQDASPLVAGDYVAGQPLVVIDDGTQFRLTSLTINQITASTTFATYVSNNYAKGSLIARRVFSTPGTFTYTPTAGTNSISVTVQAGGGGGGSTAATGASTYAIAGGGGSGGRADSDISSGFAGATITVGAGGAGAIAGTGGGLGSAGGSSSFGAFLSATGGFGGSDSPAGAGAIVQAGGSPGYGSGGNVDNIPGIPGLIASGSSGTNFCSGGGGASTFGGGGTPIYPTTTGAGGNQGYGFGSGGSGAGAAFSSSGQTGGAGANGVVIIEEYA